MSEKFSIKRALLPALVFSLTYAAHYLWFVQTGSAAPASSSGCCGTSCEALAAASGLAEYLKTQTFFLGYSVALSLAFASVAIRQFLEKRSKGSQRAAVGGVSASAILGFAGCYLTGCCGSPMLGVYIGLLGPTFLPFAKPLVAAITTISILVSARFLSKQKATETCCEGDSTCAPVPVQVLKRQTND